MARQCLTIILAAGKGTRMKSPLPKVLHKIAGLPMLGHVVACARKAGSNQLAIVTGHGAEEVSAALGALNIQAEYFKQKEQLGTGDAVNAARSAIDKGPDDVLVMFGDTPLVEAETLLAAREQLANGVDVVVIGFRTDEPTGYGRLVEQEGQLKSIVEEKEATDQQKTITYCNGGLMAFNGKHLPAILDKIGNNNRKGEYYLTDAVEIANGMNLNVRAIETPMDSTLGVNTRVELAAVESIWQERARKLHMLAGVAMTAPDTVFLHHDTTFGENVMLEPNVYFGPAVQVADNAKIRAYSHLEGCKIGEGAEVGPFARLRPGADLGTSSKVGNFCEVKNAEIGQGAKINHLTYIGDAAIGAGSNVGAGTITCNYDGYNKFKTSIGTNAFIGSNTALIAPVNVGDNAYIASGSVISDDVPADALGIGRGRQENKPGLAKKLRARFKAIKEAGKKS